MVGTVSVLPFEPYYKLEMKLLEMAVAGQRCGRCAAQRGTVPEQRKRPPRLGQAGVEVLTQIASFGAKLVARAK